jgi:hypothetical protein
MWFGGRRGMKKAYPHVLCVLIAVVGSLVSIYLSPSAQVAAAAAKGLFALGDITEALRAGGFNLLVFTGHPSASPELGGISPKIYSDVNTHDILYIYVFKSVSDRSKVVDGGIDDRLMTSFSTANLLPWFFTARNVLIVVMPVQTPSLEQFKMQNQRLQALGDIVFFRLNGGKVLVFRGEGTAWKAEVVYAYYEYWFPDPSGRLQYENWDKEHPWIITRAIT